MHFTLLFAFSAPISRATAEMAQTDDAADTREPIAARSGNNRASRVLALAFLRQRPSLPPAFCAGIMPINAIYVNRLSLTKYRGL